MKVWITVTVMMVGLCAMAQNDTVRYFHPNGTLSSVGRLEDGKPEGFWRSYHANGNPRSEGERRAHQLEGTWRFFDEEGLLETEIDYAAGSRNGEVRRYAPDGTPISVETYVDDQKHGNARYYHPNGALHKEVPFLNGKEEGRGTEYDPEGRIVALLQYGAGMLRRREEINRVDAQGLRQGPWREFHPDGRVKWEANYVDDRLQGIYKEFDSKGTLKELRKYDAGTIDERAQENLMVEIRRTFHPGGRLATIGSYSKSGKREGLFKEFAVDGTLERARIYRQDQLVSEGLVDERGALVGAWTEFFASGEKRAEGAYQEGKREGDWTFFHRSGKVEQKGRYVNGLPNGPWRWYHENGKIHREENYRRGREDGPSAEYDPEGGVITQGEYIDGRREGLWTYELGDHREEGRYKDGERDGNWVFTYENGRRSFQGDFVNGDPHGRHRWWWPNGQLRMEGRYSMGREQGEWTHYSEQGVVVMTIRYRDGAAIRIDGSRVPPPYQAGEVLP